MHGNMAKCLGGISIHTEYIISSTGRARRGRQGRPVETPDADLGCRLGMQGAGVDRDSRSAAQAGTTYVCMLHTYSVDGGCCIPQVVKTGWLVTSC